MYLVTGAKGQLGQELKNIFSNAIYTDASDLDITDPSQINNFIQNKNIEGIINCAAYTAVDHAEDNVELATKINSDALVNLAKTGLKIIHISTDYVFDGKNHKPYSELDVVNPISVYGKTKLSGEKNLLEYAETAVIIRTSWLYSIYGNNFMKTIKKLGEQKDSLNVVCDQIGTPTNAKDLAEAIVCMLPSIAKGKKEIYHFSNEGVASWYDFAHEIISLLELECEVKPVPSSNYKTKATRPFYSVLDKSKIKTEFSNMIIPNWRNSLKSCIKQF